MLRGKGKGAGLLYGITAPNWVVERADNPPASIVSTENNFIAKAKERIVKAGFASLGNSTRQLGEDSRRGNRPPDSADDEIANSPDDDDDRDDE
jgi:hypothetical protein